MDFNTYLQNCGVGVVVKVYIGRKTGCQCGCSGEYYYASQYARDAKNHGATVNDAKALKVFRTMQAAYADMSDEEKENNTFCNTEGIPHIFNCMIGKKPYTIYMKE
jgi:hypothetical protein